MRVPSADAVQASATNRFLRRGMPLSQNMGDSVPDLVRRLLEDRKDDRRFFFCLWAAASMRWHTSHLVMGFGSMTFAIVCHLMLPMVSAVADVWVGSK